MEKMRVQSQLHAPPPQKRANQSLLCDGQLPALSLAPLLAPSLALVHTRAPDLDPDLYPKIKIMILVLFFSCLGWDHV